jgi:hypothetical protein
MSYPGHKELIREATLGWYEAHRDLASSAAEQNIPLYEEEHFTPACETPEGIALKAILKPLEILIIECEDELPTLDCVVRTVLEDIGRPFLEQHIEVCAYVHNVRCWRKIIASCFVGGETATTSPGAHLQHSGWSVR